MGKLVLQIYDEDNTPLTLVEVARVIKGLKDKQIHETANATYSVGGESLPRRCDNKRHDLYKKCVGGGICLAKKYRRCGVSLDQICGSCESDVITDTLNYIFETYYGGKYRAQWRKTRVTSRSRPERPAKKAKKTRGEDKHKEQLQALNDMITQPVKKKGRPKKDNQAKVKKIQTEEKKLAVPRNRQRQLRGGPGRVRQVEAA